MPTATVKMAKAATSPPTVLLREHTQDVADVRALATDCADISATAGYGRNHWGTHAARWRFSRERLQPANPTESAWDG